MFHFHRFRKIHLRKTTELSFSRLILALGLSGIDTIWAIYMSSFGLSDSMIGFISAFLIVVSLSFTFFSTIILEKLGEYRIFIFSLLLSIISYIIIAYFNSLYIFLIFSIILTVLSVLRLESFDILFRDESSNKKLNSDESLMYALLNVGWFIGPIIAGFILALYGLSAVFYSSSILMIIAFFFFLKLRLKPIIKKREIYDLNVIKNIKDYFSSKKLFLPYCVSMGVEIWWALIYIYVPLFIIQRGLGGEMVGYFLAAVVLPLMFLEIEVGKFSEKFGLKKFFFFGFLLLSIFSLICFFISDIYLILILLILSSFAMALIEPLQDTFFFKQVKSIDEEKFYPIYSTATDFGSFISKILIAGILLFFVDKFAYLLMFFLMFLIALITLKIKD